MADDIRSTQVSTYIELEPGDLDRVTKTGVYLEVKPLEPVRTTTAGIYIETYWIPSSGPPLQVF